MSAEPAAPAPATEQGEKAEKGWWSKKKPPTIPEDFVFDKDARHTGTVMGYAKWQGYGFITPDQAGLVPEDKLWVHWSNVQTDDRFPFLTKDLKVEFGLMKWKSGRGEKETTSLRAKTVTNVGGASIALQESVDAEKKEFLNGSQSTRYTGMLKFYVPKQGYGYVTIDESMKVDEAVVGKELRVEEPEVNAGGRRPTSFLENTPVEFGIVKNRKDQYMVYNMTMPGGAPLSKANLEHRQAQGEQTFNGTISHFHWRQGWGFIIPENTAALPASIQQALAKQQEEAKAKRSDEAKAKSPEDPAQVFYFTKADVLRGASPKQDMKVVFKAYLDDKGVGASEVTVFEEAA